MKTKSTQKRLALLKAAFAVVTEKGYFETKVADVARRAGVAKGTVYIYFKDKPAIYIGLVDWLLEQALAVLRDIAARPLSPREKLDAVFDAWAGTVFSRPAVIGLLSMESIDRSTKTMNRFRKQVLPHMTEMIDEVAAVIADGVKAGEFSRVEPRLAALLYLNAFRAGMFVVANRWPVADPSAAARELFFSGLSARGRARLRPARDK
jgi:TetR/AcrR family fatty acid metabolism transcriptional regulator